MIHTDSHTKAGKTVTLKLAGPHMQIQSGDPFQIEDWWDRVGGRSWMDMKGNPACIIYGVRSGVSGLPLDNEVVYGKVGPFGHLIHVSELGDEVTDAVQSGQA